MVHSEGWRASGESGGEPRSGSREHRAAARAVAGSSGEPHRLGAVGGSGLSSSHCRARWRAAPAFAAWAVLLNACGTNNSYYIEQHTHLGPDAGAVSTAPLEPPGPSEPAPVDPRPDVEASGEGEAPLAGE